jgi:hypothetical protein
MEREGWDMPGSRKMKEAMSWEKSDSNGRDVNGMPGKVKIRLCWF